MANVLIKKITDTKTRTLVLITLAILVIGIVVAVTQINSSSSPLKEKPSMADKIPRGIQSTPGGKVTERYRQLQQEANILGTKKAEEEGKSFVPTIVADVTTTEKGTLAEHFGKKTEDSSSEGCTPCPQIEAKKTNEAFNKMLAMNPNLNNILEQNPLLKAMASEDPILAQLLANNPELAKLLAENPHLLKLIKENPGLASTLLSNPKLLNILKNNPSLATMLANNPKLASMLSKNPSLAELWDKNPELANKMLAQLGAGNEDEYLASILQDQINDELQAQEFELNQRKEQEAEKLALLNEARLKAIENFTNAMSTQASSAMSAWNTVPTQAYVAGTAAPANEGSEGKLLGKLGGSKDSAAGDVSSVAETKASPVIKAGEIIYGVLETAINSDEPSPIMARIVQGKYKGAKLIGRMGTRASKYSEKVVLGFQTLNIPGFENSVQVDAVAIDLDTARAAIASRVDNHYLYRYGTLFASSFLEGYSKAVVDKGATTTINQNSLGTTSTQTNRPELSGRQQLFQGLGKVGESLSTALSGEFNRPSTITVDAGTSFGVLFLTDVSLDNIAATGLEGKVGQTAGQALSTTVGTGLNAATAATNAALGGGQTTGATQTPTGGSGGVGTNTVTNLLTAITQTIQQSGGNTNKE